MIRVKATALEERQKTAWSVMKDTSWMKVKDVKVDSRLCLTFVNRLTEIYNQMGMHMIECVQLAPRVAN